MPVRRSSAKVALSSTFGDGREYNSEVLRWSEKCYPYIAVDIADMIRQLTTCYDMNGNQAYLTKAGELSPDKVGELRC